jgi:alkanesulfonate monooxygenase SsuD/methylene tetrahydromethanopterin reductase-like flavin-dependent oxidoreductase (luciferase family)
LGAVEEATAEAEKHGDRSSELLAALAEAWVTIEQARAVQAERAKAAVEEAEAAAERQQMEEEVAALALSMKSGALRMQMQAQLRAASCLLPRRTPIQRRHCAWCASTRPKDQSSCRAVTCT